MIGSIAEATYMTGMERNSDLVFAASYAPLLGNVNAQEWTPNLIAFNANNVVLSTSYFVQQMFSVNRGDTILPVSPVRSAPFYYVASINSVSGTVFIKATNTGSTAVTFAVAFDSTISVGTKGTATLLTSATTSASNTLASPNAVTPVVSSFVGGPRFTYSESSPTLLPRS